MANNGYIPINMYPQQLGRLTHLNLSQAQLAPIQALDTQGNRNNQAYKATYTSDYFIRPVFGKPRLNVDYGELEPLENSILIRMVTNHIIDSVCTTDFGIVPIKEEEEISEISLKPEKEDEEKDNEKEKKEKKSKKVKKSVKDGSYYCGKSPRNGRTRKGANPINIKRRINDVI